MKKIKSFLIASVFMFAANQVANAQAKVAHVDVSEIISKMPAMLDAQKQLKKIDETYNTEYKKLIDDYQAKIAKYDKEAATATAAVNEERAKEVQSMQGSITEFREKAQKDLQAKQDEITRPIYDKVKASIQKVAKMKGFQYVFDAAALLVADGTNITVDVKKDLGF